MMRSFLPCLSTLLVLGTLSTVASAESVNQAIATKGQYWQRVSSSSAIYMRGPKAQQMLNRDISRCVIELKELERLGDIHDAIPPYVDQGKILSEAEAQLEGIDAPERDEQLFYEPSVYHDFEGCMMAKGWERIMHVPYDVAIQARENYLDTHVDYKDRNKMATGLEAAGENPAGYSDYDHLND